jgi:hypothetical protein
MRRLHKAADANRGRSSGRTSAELRARARANILVDFVHPRVSNAWHNRRERVARVHAKETARFLLIARFPGYFPALDLVAALTGTDRQRVSLSASRWAAAVFYGIKCCENGIAISASPRITRGSKIRNIPKSWNVLFGRCRQIFLWTRERSFWPIWPVRMKSS